MEFQIRPELPTLAAMFIVYEKHSATSILIGERCLAYMHTLSAPWVPIWHLIIVSFKVLVQAMFIYT